MEYDVSRHEYIFGEYDNEEYEELVEVYRKQEKELAKLDNAFPRLLRMRLRDNRNAIVFMTGEPGSGKSYSAISLARAVDPTFTIDRVVFDPKKYMNFLDISRNALPKYSAIIFDDAGVNENARDWQKEQVKILGYLSQTMRILNYLVIFTTPLATFIEKQTRSLITYELVASKSYFNPITMDINDARGEFKLYEFVGGLKLGSTEFVAYRKFVQVPLMGQWVNLKYVHIAKPSREIAEEYEKRKMEFLKEKYGEYARTLSGENIEQTKTYKSKRGLNPNSLKNLKPFRDPEKFQKYIQKGSLENIENSQKKKKHQSIYNNYKENVGEDYITNNILNEGDDK